MTKKFSMYIFMKTIGYFIGFISFTLIARRLGSVTLGTVVFATSYITLFQSFSDLGYSTAHIKRVSEGKDFGKCNGTYFTVKIGLNIFMALLVVGSVLLQKYVLKSENMTSTREVVIYIVLVGMVLHNLAGILHVTFSARKEIAKRQIGELSEVFFNRLLKIGVALLGLSVYWLAGVKVISAIIWVVVLWIFFHGYPVKKFDLEYFKSYTKIAFPVIISEFLKRYAHHLDKVMIGYFLTSEIVGKYAVGKRLGEFFFMFVMASNILLFPTYSKLHSQGKLEKVRLLANKVERYFSMFLIPIAILFTMNARAICYYIVGDEFLDLSPAVLSILVWYTTVTATMHPYSEQIIATDHAKLGANISVAYLSLNVVLNFIFIPERLFAIKLLGMGAVGAAVATLISAIIGSIIYRIYAFRITGSTPNKRVLTHLFAGLVMILTLLLPSVLLDDFGLVARIGFNILGILAYAIILFMLGELRKYELKYLFSFLNIKEIGRYGINELKGK